MLFSMLANFYKTYLLTVLLEYFNLNHLVVTYHKIWDYPALNHSTLLYFILSIAIVASYS